MSFARLFLFLVLVPALTMADGDKNFKITPKQFKVGTVVESIKDMALKAEKGIVVSEKIQLPLKENKIYLRHKMGAKDYQWVSGNLIVNNYKKLHAFSLKDNYLKIEDVAYIRFYGSQNTKAFQDETDIYFDRKYLYSPRVPKLFFIKNGKWQIINEVSLPGVIRFDIDDKTVNVSSMQKAYVDVPKMIYPVELGVHSFIFSKPNSLPYVDVGVVDAGSELVFKPNFTKVEKLDKKAPVTITIDEINRTDDLEKLEKLHDKFIMELEKASENLDTSLFVKVYPQMRDASSLGISESNDEYVEYVSRYKTKRMEARKIWSESLLGDVSHINTILRKKLDSLEALPLRVYIQHTSIEPTYIDVPVDLSIDSAKTLLSSSLDSAKSKPDSIKVTTKKQMDKVKIVFGVDKSRYDFSWTGTFDGLVIDSVYNWINSNSSGKRIILNVKNNKPVWIYNEGVISGRHHYRYVSLELQVDNSFYKGIGTFTLPNYILKEPVVQEWFNSKDVSVPIAKENKKIEKEKSMDIKMPSIADIAASARVIRDKIHGSVAMIDSGKFRFKGRVVTMSPFAIMTTEMTQKLFEQTMKTLDSTKRILDRSTFKNPNKPVHNITWEDARFVCTTLGGDLPSEAQWEFAALADNTDGAIWVKDSVSDPGSYAIYRGNSYNLGKKFSEFGPQQVKTKLPNAWGLYDMSGNVAEWTRDKYFMFSFWIEPSNPTGAMFGSSKVYKGGSWKDKENLLNVTNTDDEDPRYWSETIGFRCVYPQEIIKE